MDALKHTDAKSASGAVHTVLFDVGSTLILPDPPVEEVFCNIARRRGHELSLAAVAPHMTEVFDFYEEEYAKDGDFWCSKQGSIQIWLDMYRYLCALTGLQDDDAGMAQAVYDSYATAQYWKPYDDVRSTLMMLKRQGYQLGIVSNWDPALRDIMRGMQLAPFFDEIISSADVGYRKPDPQIFEVALERLGALRQTTVHVGDLPEADGAGASSAGITPVIIDRDGTEEECGCRRVKTLMELPSLLEGLWTSPHSKDF